jgi:acetate kinase
MVPLRLSGDLQATPGITLEGPCGTVALRSGVVCALRHIHMNPTDADRLGVRDHEVVEVAIKSDGRPVIFGEVVVRVSPDYRLEFHLDTDEGNAAGVGPETVAYLTSAHPKSREA